MKSIDQYLVQDLDGKFVDKTWLLGLFGSVVYTPTGEKVKGGFRYYSCPAQQVIAAFEARDLPALAGLPFSLDDDGEPDTSAVLINLHYTPSGSAVAMQVSEYQDHQPVAVTPVWLSEGPEAQAMVAQVKTLDQST